MGRIDNTGEDPYAELLRRIEALETANPLANASVTDGRTRFFGQNAFLLDGSGRVTGQLYVEGLEEVSGQLRVTGSLVLIGNADFSGPMNVTGNLDIRGNTTFIGPLRVEGETTVVGTMVIEGALNIKGKTTVTGELIVQGDVTFTGVTKLNGKTDIKGDTTVTGDVEVKGGGQIRAGALFFGPTYGGGAGGMYSNQAMFLGAAGLINLLANSSVDITTADGTNVRGGLRVIAMAQVAANASGYSQVLVHNATGALVRVA